MWYGIGYAPIFGVFQCIDTCIISPTNNRHCTINLNKAPSVKGKLTTTTEIIAMQTTEEYVYRIYPNRGRVQIEARSRLEARVCQVQ